MFIDNDAICSWMYWHCFCVEKNKKDLGMIRLTLIFLLILNCSSPDKDLNLKYITKGTLIRLNSYTETCQGLIEMQCLLIQKGDQIGTENWDYFYDYIEGFEYDEGFKYDLDVKIITVRNPPADAFSLRYRLIKVVRKF